MVKRTHADRGFYVLVKLWWKAAQFLCASGRGWIGNHMWQDSSGMPIVERQYWGKRGKLPLTRQRVSDRGIGTLSVWAGFCWSVVVVKAVIL